VKLFLRKKERRRERAYRGQEKRGLSSETKGKIPSSSGCPLLTWGLTDSKKRSPEGDPNKQLKRKENSATQLVLLGDDEFDIV